MRGQSLRIVFSLLLALLLLGGCAAEDMRQRPGSTQANAGKTKSSVQDLHTAPKHINRTIGENIVVDADVIVPQSTEMPVLIMSPVRFDERCAQDVFFPKRTPARTRTIDEWIDGSDDVITNLSFGQSVLVFSTGAIIYTNNNLDIYELPLLEVRRSGISQAYGEHYGKEELVNLPKTQAIEDVKNVLQNLGLSAEGEFDIYTLDRASMQKRQDDIIKTQDLSWEINVKKMKVKEQLTIDDEAYMIVFKPKILNIDVTQTSYNIATADRDMNGMTIEALYSRKGLVRFSGIDLYKRTGVEQTPQTVLTAEAAVETLSARWSSIISNSKLKVVRIALEYVPIPRQNDLSVLLYTPCWVATVETTHSSSKGGSTVENTSIDYWHVDAVSGSILN
jgi:hypothetical protein